MSEGKNPQVFLELSFNGRIRGRLTIELYANIVPKTAENFRLLCTGERGIGVGTNKPLHFKGSSIYRIIRGLVAQGGDFSKENGLGGESIYGGPFPDENFQLKHDARGIVSMGNSGRHSNESLFLITFDAVPQLDGKHVVFGKVVHGMELLDELEEVATDNGRPSKKVLITDCGQVRDVLNSGRMHGGSKRRSHTSRDESDQEDKRENRVRKTMRGSQRRYRSSKRRGSSSGDSEGSHERDKGRGVPFDISTATLLGKAGMLISDPMCERIDKWQDH